MNVARDLLPCKPCLPAFFIRSLGSSKAIIPRWLQKDACYGFGKFHNKTNVKLLASIGSSSSGSGGVTKFMKSLYRDEFRWSLIKSVGLFALGIAIARDNDHDDSLALFKCCMIRHIVL